MEKTSLGAINVEETCGGRYGGKNGGMCREN